MDFHSSSSSSRQNTRSFERRDYSISPLSLQNRYKIDCNAWSFSLFVVLKAILYSFVVRDEMSCSFCLFLLTLNMALKMALELPVISIFLADHLFSLWSCFEENQHEYWKDSDSSREEMEMKKQEEVWKEEVRRQSIAGMMMEGEDILRQILLNLDITEYCKSLVVLLSLLTAKNSPSLSCVVLSAKTRRGGRHRWRLLLYRLLIDCL